MSSIPLQLILEVFAFVIFVLASWWIAEPYRWRLVPAGLAFLTLALLVGGAKL